MACLVVQSDRTNPECILLNSHMFNILIIAKLVHKMYIIGAML